MARSHQLGPGHSGFGYRPSCLPHCSYERIFTPPYNNRLHRALGNVERELAQSADRCRFVEYQTRIAEIESAVRLLKVARPFEVDLQRLRIHLRMVQEDISRMGAVN